MFIITMIKTYYYIDVVILDLLYHKDYLTRI